MDSEEEEEEETWRPLLGSGRQCAAEGRAFSASPAAPPHAHTAPPPDDDDAAGTTLAFAATEAGPGRGAEEVAPTDPVFARAPELAAAAAPAPASRPLIDLTPPGEEDEIWPPPAARRGVGGQPGAAGVVGPPGWHLTFAIIVASFTWLGRTVPDEASLTRFLDGRYGIEPPIKKRTGLVLPDRSHSSFPYNTTWQECWVAAVGHVDVRHEGRRYEHYYLGMAGHWVQLPYMPRVHMKGQDSSFKYGAGLCYRGRCVCIPHKKAPCLKVTFDSSSLLSLVLGLNGALFFAGLAWPPDSTPGSKLSRFCTLSLYRLLDGHLLPVLTAPFFHVGLIEFGRNMALLVNLFESCAEQGVLLFLALYIGGSFAHFLGATAAFRFWGPQYLLHMQTSMGCRGGLSSLLALLSRVAPNQRFRISLYMIDVPTPLSPLATIACNAAVDAVFAASRGRHHAEILGHLAAMLWGRALAEIFAAGGMEIPA